MEVVQECRVGGDLSVDGNLDETVTQQSRTSCGDIVEEFYPTLLVLHARFPESDSRDGGFVSSPRPINGRTRPPPEVFVTVRDRNEVTHSGAESTIDLKDLINRAEHLAGNLAAL